MCLLAVPLGVAFYILLRRCLEPKPKTPLTETLVNPLVFTDVEEQKEVINATDLIQMVTQHRSL